MRNENRVRLKRIVPLLQVASMADTIAYYQEALGFSLDFVWPSDGAPKWARVSRDGVSFELTIDLGTSSAQFIAERGNGVVFYVIAEKVASLYEELLAHEATIVQELRDFGTRKQFSVADRNGYVIAFAQESDDRKQ